MARRPCVAATSTSGGFCSVALVGLVGAALLFTSSPASANGRFPAANQIVFSPINPDLIVLRASYGILPSHDNGATWQFLCGDAIGDGTTRSRTHRSA